MCIRDRDDPVIRDTTCYFLKSQQNFEVVCAETVSYTHLDVYKRQVKNLVLMGATGPRIEKAVREDPNFNEAELPIQHLSLIHICDAFHRIRDGYEPVMVCGGAESCISPLGTVSYTHLDRHRRSSARPHGHQ